MTVHLWVGPTLPPADRSRIPEDVEIHAPAHAGSFLDVDPGPADVLVLADGVYWGTPALQLPEIMAAVGSGATMVGVSSIGALRAADLQGVPGVIGAGRVFEMIATGAGVTDADVGVIHDGSPPYLVRSVPLINLKITASSVRPLLSEEEHRILGEAIDVLAKRSLHERTWIHLLRLLEAAGAAPTLFDVVRSRYVDQKALDLLEVLDHRHLFADISTRAVWRPTMWWETRLGTSERFRGELHEGISATNGALAAAADPLRLATVAHALLAWWDTVPEDVRVRVLASPRLARSVATSMLSDDAHPAALSEVEPVLLLDTERSLPAHLGRALAQVRRSYVPEVARLICRWALLEGDARPAPKSQVRAWVGDVTDLAESSGLPLLDVAIVGTRGELAAAAEDD